MHDDFTFPVEYIRLIADQLRVSNVDVDAWMRRSGFSEQPERLVPYPAFRRLVLEALAMSREPALGLFVGERLVATTHGMVGFAAVNSSSVKMALEIMERFSRLRTMVFAITHHADGEDVRVSFSELLPL
ncbi:MAG TPA: AraC family transcriptional regulator ligand-binding domain-containing protein, partial [Polyangiales bacterium]